MLINETVKREGTQISDGFCTHCNKEFLRECASRHPVPADYFSCVSKK